MNSSIKQIFLNLCLVVLAFAVQTGVFPLMPFLAVYPNLMVILTFSLGFIRGSRSGMAYGLVAGLLLDLSSGGPLGFYTLIYIWLGYLNGICTRYYYEDYITLPLVLSALNELIYNFYLYSGFYKHLSQIIGSHATARNKNFFYRFCLYTDFIQEAVCFRNRQCNRNPVSRPESKITSRYDDGFISFHNTHQSTDCNFPLHIFKLHII